MANSVNDTDSLKNSDDAASSLFDSANSACNSFSRVIFTTGGEESKTLSEIEKIINFYNLNIGNLIEIYRNDFKNVKKISEDFKNVDQTMEDEISGGSSSTSDDVENVSDSYSEYSGNKYELSRDDELKIMAVVAHEARAGSYDDAFAVASVIFNRADQNFNNNGTSPIDQINAPKQFFDVVNDESSSYNTYKTSVEEDVNFSDQNVIPEYVWNAVLEAENGSRNHNYLYYDMEGSKILNNSNITEEEQIDTDGGNVYYNFGEK